MRLLIFCPYYSPHIGGLESHADEFNKYLSRKGADIIVFTPRLPKDAPEYEIRHNGVHPVKSGEAGPAKREFNGVKIIRFPAFEIIPGYPLPRFWKFRFWKLFFNLFKENPDIVISRTRFFVTSIMAMKYAKLKRKKWIHIEHGSDFVKLTSKLKTSIALLYDHTFGRLIFKSSDLNISISKAVQKFVNKFDKRQSPVIYRGLDMEEIDKIKPDYGMREKYRDKTIISFAGRLYKWKGVKNSILAVKSLPPEIKKRIIFIIMGDGEDRRNLKKAAADDEAIIFTGNLPREKAIGILKVSDIYLHSSYSGGGLSTSLLEAMYCGCTIIATPNEGADEVIENNKNGFLIEKSDAKLISEKLLEVLGKNTADQKEKAKNNIQEKFGNNAYNEVKDKFNWNQSTEMYLKIFSKMQKI